MITQELLSAAKLRLRKTQSNILDGDIDKLAEVAIADLKRIGVSARFLTDCADPIIKEAVLTYINANFGNSPESERLTASYNMLLTKIKGGRYFDE